MPDITAATPTPPQDPSGPVLAVIALLVSIGAGLVAIFRGSKKEEAPAPVATPNGALLTNPGGLGAVWHRIDELAGDFANYRERVARDYATRADLEEALGLLRDIDQRARRTETILETVFNETLKRKREGG